MNSIIVNLNGGLGNQMFQFAFALELSALTQRSVIFARDQAQIYGTRLELEPTFGINLHYATHNEMSDVLGWKAHPQIRRAIARPILSWLRDGSFISEAEYEKGLWQRDGEAYFHGYWQSEEYFSTVQQNIRALFKFQRKLDATSQAFSDKLQHCESVAIHVRCGDYFSRKNRSVYEQLQATYYQSAAREIESRVDNPKFFVFSDDPDWAWRNIASRLKNCEMVPHVESMSVERDMHLMSHAHHNIIANSTFSWWAAWLNPNPHKQIVGPVRWFAAKMPTRRILPVSWIAL